MKKQALAVYTRTASGKGGARQLRATGSVPAILYGEHTAPAALSLSAHEFSNILKKSTSEHILLDLNVQGGDGGSELALVKDVQRDPISGDVLHVDFLHILPTKALRVTVPVRIRGIADGVKNFGGILQHVSRHLEVEAIPADIPDIIDVDVSHLGIGDAVHVRDVIVERVTIVSPGDRTVASVVPPTVLKEAVPAEGVVTEETAAGAPEVIGEKERLEKLAAEETGKEGKEKEKEKPKEKAKEKK